MRRAREHGFDVVGVTRPDAIPLAKERLARFLADGAHGDMAWMEGERRGDPRALWPDVRSVVMLGLNYGDGGDPLAILERRERGAISVYAQGDDYHDIIKPRLKALARWLATQAGGDVKVFVDTAALMEKPLAAAAGLGWQGKHTNLLSRQHGSWLFLGAILTTLDLPPDAPGGGSLRKLPRLPRRLPDRGIPRALPARCPALHLLSHHRAQGPDRARAAAADGQPHLRLRRLPGGVPVEQVRAGGPRGEARGSRGSCRRRGSPISPRSTTRRSASCSRSRRSSAPDAIASCATC